MGIMASASIWVANVLGYYVLVVYMGAIVSMQFFGGEVYALNDFSGRWSKRGRLNFDTFGMSFITNFVVITGDGWNEVMYSTMHACGGISAVYFVLILVIARYAILSDVHRDHFRSSRDEIRSWSSSRRPRRPWSRSSSSSEACSMAY